MEPSDKEGIYYIVFRDSELDTWMMRRLRKGFKHCLAVTQSQGKQFWIIIDPKSGNLMPEILPSNFKLSDIFPNSTIMKCEVVIPKKIHNRFWHINCVEIVKRILGISNCKIITPYQLYKYLKKRG